MLSYPCICPGVRGNETEITENNSEKQVRNPGLFLPESEKVAYNPGGENIRRSPPVSFLGIGCAVIPIPGLCAELMLRRGVRTMRRGVNNGENRRPGAHRRENIAKQ